MKLLINRFALLSALVALPFTLFAGTLQTVTLDVKNMTCAVCPITVKKALEKVSGVTNATVDFDKKTASVTFDPDKASPCYIGQSDFGRRLSFHCAQLKSCMSDVLLESVLVCPVCGFAKRETMPTDACRFFYECTRCQALLRPKPGDCCVFCSYGSVKCPPMQDENRTFSGAE